MSASRSRATCGCMTCGLHDALDVEVELVERQLGEQALARPDVRRLLTIPDVGAITALVLVAVIRDVTRFPSPRHLVSHLGHHLAVHARRDQMPIARIPTGPLHRPPALVAMPAARAQHALVIGQRDLPRQLARADRSQTHRRLVHVQSDRERPKVPHGRATSLCGTAGASRQPTQMRRPPDILTERPDYPRPDYPAPTTRPLHPVWQQSRRSPVRVRLYHRDT
jgi:hypothetical protein